MKFARIAGVVGITLISVAIQGFAQKRPAPTGQVPKAYTGQQSSPYAGYQPRPTGQIAPAAVGQSPANLPRPAVSTQPQSLGFEPGKSDITAEGQVPKVNSNQDPRTFPERYQSTTTTAVGQTTTAVGEQLLPAQNGQPGSYPAQSTQTNVTTQTTQTNGAAAGTQTSTANQQTPASQPAQGSQQVPAQNSQPAQQRSPSQISPQPQSAAPAAAPGAPKRMDP
ncbi:hypothetical protein [Dyadobacter aurulentus]|uniref:hypothetical protein n=1 Tax=Dyadobacter sp. UC 10 TaxID=2605428 RepID=UPI0011F33948|nr:hypothetical protein [Dyadobacter sp. UC 10]KAA0993030.1 hypothetical protein FXO21_24095 [Dyadobacter sp. UC 10]